MQVVRIYTGDDDESHFEELDLPYEQMETSEGRLLKTPRTSTSADTSQAVSSIGIPLRADNMSLP